MIRRYEKISAKKINNMKSDFGNFIWFDFVTPGYEDYTCYATGHCAVVSQDKELRNKVEEVEPEQKYLGHLEKEFIALIDACSQGGSIKWQNTGITVGELKNPIGDFFDYDKQAKDGDVFFKDHRNLVFFYDGYGIEIVKNNFIEFLRMFSGNVSGNTIVYYSHYMDAIGICYKGEYGLLMSAIK